MTLNHECWMSWHMSLFKLGLKEQCWVAVGGEQALTHTERMNKIPAVLLSCQWGHRPYAQNQKALDLRAVGPK